MIRFVTIENRSNVFDKVKLIPSSKHSKENVLIRVDE